MTGLIRLSAGDLFANDFDITRVVAEGGMGTIYEARDRTASGQVCALKVLHTQLVADEQSRRRFQQESQVSAQIASPHVPKVFRAGVDPRSGTPFISMELLVGRDLRRFVTDRGPVPTDEARRIFEQVTHALAAAHRMGLVHRDLKPENIFLQETGGLTEVKLLDFGVSKLIDLHKTSGAGTGAVGSPLWMAPEQTSAGGRIAPATDVWALGLVSFYVLTGTLYWKAAQDESGVAGLLREIHLDPIALPSVRVRELGLDLELPPGYDEWFLRAMQRAGTDRFAEAGAAMDGLRAVLSPPRPDVDRSAVAYASTLEFDSPIEPGMVLGSPGTTQPFGGITLKPPPNLDDEEEAGQTHRDLPKVAEVPETQRSLPRVEVPEAAADLPRRTEPQSREPSGPPWPPATPLPPIAHGAPQSSRPAPRPEPLRPRSAAETPPGARRSSLSPMVLVTLLVGGGCFVTVLAAALVWVVLFMLNR